MTSIGDVIQSGTQLVQPSDQERRRLESMVEALLSRTRAEARKHREIRDVILGGSYAKDTWLPHDVDIDVFVRFSPKTNESTFEKIGLDVGAKATAGFPRGKRYAQHPYTEATIDGTKVNIVPCYDVEPNKWRSAADRSPYHVKAVEMLPAGQKLQVRLLKRFMKCVGVYGAEIESEGFSGYAAEVLVMDHHDFEGVLRFFAEFKPHSPERMMRLQDPVDEARDLARAISNEKLSRMILASRAFLKRPSVAYFKKLREKRRSNLEEMVIAVLFSHVRLSEDTLWGELKRTLRHLEAYVEAQDFKIVRSAAASNGTDSSAFLLLPEFEALPPVQQRAGPPVDRIAETEEFIARNRRKARLLWVGDDGRLLILQDRRFSRLSSLLEDTITRIRNVGASREIASGIAESGVVIRGKALVRESTSKPWLRNGLDQIVSDTIGTGST